MNIPTFLLGILTGLIAVVVIAVIVAFGYGDDENEEGGETMEENRNDVIIIFSVGKNHTQIYADGKLYGKHITEAGFYKEAGEYPKLCVMTDILPVTGESDNESLNCFLKNISDEIQKHISKGQNATATSECDSSTNAREV